MKIILAILVIISLVVGSYTLYYFLNKPTKEIHLEPIEVACKNMSLVNTTYCIRNSIKYFYNFTKRDERNYSGNEGSIEDIMKNGGDCYDYTKMYGDYLEYFGFNNTNPIIRDTNDTKAHTFLISWDNQLDSYCIIDLLEVNCIVFEEDSF